MKSIYFTLVYLLISIALNAQLRFPDLSPLGIIEQKVGFTDIKIRYERPTARGRKLFGEVVPFNKLWRTGAGNCTKISFNEPILINNHKISAGTYSIFSIPKIDEWEIILNSDTTLYGTYNYDSKNEILRFKTKASKTERYFEALTFDIDVVSNNAEIYLAWENTQIHFPIKTFADDKIMENISQNLLSGKSTNWDDYSGAVEYYLYNNLDLNQALFLANKAIQLNGELYSYVVKLQVLERQKKYAEAIEVANNGLKFIEKNGTKLGYSDLEIKSMNDRIVKLNQYLK